MKPFAKRSASFKLRVKKTKLYRERSEEKRREFLDAIRQIPPEDLVYVDEMGMDSFLYREYARAPRGERVFGVISGRKYKRRSMVAGKCGKKILAPLAYEGTTDSALFEFWFEHVLIPELSAGQIVVLDNATFHRKNKLYRLAEKAGCSVIFLPPYSPDLNPIENFWAWLKRKMKDMLRCCAGFDEALSACFQLA
jgi:hypothetical protein